MKKVWFMLIVLLFIFSLPVFAEETTAGSSLPDGVVPEDPFVDPLSSLTKETEAEKPLPKEIPTWGEGDSRYCDPTMKKTVQEYSIYKVLRVIDMGKSGVLTGDQTIEEYLETAVAEYYALPPLKAMSSKHYFYNSDGDLIDRPEDSDELLDFFEYVFDPSLVFGSRVEVYGVYCFGIGEIFYQTDQGEYFLFSERSYVTENGKREAKDEYYLVSRDEHNKMRDAFLVYIEEHGDVLENGGTFQTSDYYDISSFHLQRHLGKKGTILIVTASFVLLAAASVFFLVWRKKRKIKG